MRIGVTGHAELTPEAARIVAAALSEKLQEYAGPDLAGISCMCHGADLIFARAVIEVDGRLEAVLPAEDYRSVIPQEHVGEYDDVLRQAAAVSRLPFQESSRAAFKAASEEMLKRCDLLIAVWDGMPSRGLGDTADVVAKAKELGVPVEQLWPEGAQRLPKP